MWLWHQFNEHSASGEQVSGWSVGGAVMLGANVNLHS